MISSTRCLVSRSLLTIKPVDEVFNKAHAVWGRDESCAEVGAMTTVKLEIKGGISGAEISWRKSMVWIGWLPNRWGTERGLLGWRWYLLAGAVDREPGTWCLA